MEDNDDKQNLEAFVHSQCKTNQNAVEYNAKLENGHAYDLCER